MDAAGGREAAGRGQGALAAGSGGVPDGLGRRFGPFFELTLVGGRPDGGWEAFAELVDPAGQALARRVSAVRAALAAGRGIAEAAVEERVAASVAQLGLAARLVAPALAATVLTGAAPRLDPLRLYWRDELGGPFPLALDTGVPSPADVGPAEPTSAGPGGSFADGVLRPLVDPVVDAAARRYAVSRTVLRGNVASAVAGAAGMIGAAEPGLAEPAWRVVDELCAPGGALAGCGGRIGPTRFRRRSCCLIYRLDQAHDGTVDDAARERRGPARTALCGDCVLLPAADGQARR